jgi:hypothetical protein
MRKSTAEKIYDILTYPENEWLIPKIIPRGSDNRLEITTFCTSRLYKTDKMQILFSDTYEYLDFKIESAQAVFYFDYFDMHEARAMKELTAACGWSSVQEALKALKALLKKGKK